MSSPVIRITISPTGTSRYRVSIGDRVLIASARTPLLASARALLAEGYDPDTILEMQHRGSAIVAMSGRIGSLAGMTVDESAKYGPDFGKWAPFDAGSRLDSGGMSEGSVQGGQTAPGPHVTTTDEDASPTPSPSAEAA